MDGKQFDHFAQRLASAPSRRALLKGMLGAALGAGLGTLRPHDSEAAACKANGSVCRDHANCCSGTCGPKDSRGRRKCACPDGTVLCNGKCVTSSAFQSDASNCGACGNRCPRTTCQVGICSGGACGLAPDPKAVGKSCNDGDAGTRNDVCQSDGTCTGTPKDCSAFTDQCNDGVYDSGSRQCVKRPRSNGTSCNDGNACTQTDTCQNGVCVGGNPVVCTKLDDCHVAGTCNPATGACSNPDAPDGTTCNDGNACTVGDTCQHGVCTGGAARVCDSENPCIVDSCDPESGCVQTAKNAGTPCSDDDRCDGDEVCDGAGQCIAGTPVTCGPPADTQCQEAGVCDSETGTCSYADKADGTECTLADKCYQSASCQQGVCTGSDRVVCTASDPCHVAGTCDPDTGLCSNPNGPEGYPCGDGNACTFAESCTAGVCGGGLPVSCDDGNPCTVDSCDPVTGCVHTPKDCSDGNLCTTDTCDPQTGQCIHRPRSCSDGDPCTVDTCDPSTGCANTPKFNIAQFEADDKCNTYACDPQTGQLIKTAVTCNDGNACTTDSCDPAVGRISSQKICNDNNLCTTDTCNSATGECDFTPINCDDGNPCTIDTCDSETGCIHTPVTCPPAGQCQTSGVCDTQTGTCTYSNASNGTTCTLPNATALCLGGTCAVSNCHAGFGDCNGIQSDGCETDLTTVSNCGSCGNACASGASCVSGQCTCPSGQIACNGACVSNATTANCGTCGNTCQAVDACTPAECTSGSCNQTSFCTGYQTCGGGGISGVCGAPCPNPSSNSTYGGSCPFSSTSCTAQGAILSATCQVNGNPPIAYRQTSINVNSCAGTNYVISNCGGNLTCGLCP